MKTNLLIIAMVSILVTACTTGTQMTRTYDDDIYFSPKDVPPVSMVQDDASEGKDKTDATNQRIVISQKEKNADGTVTLNNDIYQKDENSDIQVYDLDDQELVESDTTVYSNDDSVKYVINNYYEDEDIDFAYRIHRFHRPYFYDSFFYDDWAFGYYPFYTGYYGWGYDPWYASSWGWGWGYPYSYYDYYYSPFAYGYWGYGGYYNSYYHGYYNGYYGGGGYYNDHQVARRRSTEMNVPGRNSELNETQGRNRTSVLKDGAYGNDSNQKLPTGVRGSNSSKTYVQNGHTRTRTVDGSGNRAEAKNGTIVNNRRVAGESTGQVQNRTRTSSQVARPGSGTSQVRRSYEPSTTGRTYDQSRTVRQQGQNYTPSYNKPRIANQSNYNNNGYSRPRPSSSGSYDRGVLKNGSTGNQGYSAPRSSSSMRQTYQSRSSYSSGSSGSTYRGSGRSSGSDYTPSRSSSSGSDHGAPSRSYNSGGGNYNSGSSGGSYGGSSGGGHSGGSSGGSSGGGSGHRR